MTRALSPEERLEALRAAMRKARERAMQLEEALRAKYAPDRCDRSSVWEYSVPRGKRDALKAATDRAWTAELAVVEYVNAISPRNWSAGVPMRYVTDELSFLDAITDGALSKVPPVPYGGSEMQARAFAAPLVRKSGAAC